MHVVLSGYYGFDNVGDEAILFSIIHALRKLHDGIDITVLSNNPEATEKTYGVRAVNRWKLKNISNVLKQADGLISGGGSLLQDQTGIKSIPYYSGIMRIAKMHNIPVFVYAQGMGPINKGISKFIVRNTMKKVDRITVRDEDSRALLQNLGVRKSIDIVPDPVLGLDGSTFQSKWLESSSLTTGGYITVSVRDWPSPIDFKKKIAESLDQLASSGEKIVFIPMHGEHDYKTSEELAKMMKAESVIAPSDLSIEEKIAVIGYSKLLIGMRLHSLIFSSIFYTPFIALSYDPKIDAFANIVAQPVIGHVEKDNWDAAVLTQKAKDILASEDAKEQLQKKVQPLQAKTLNTAKMALELFGQAKK
ncbi:polysaccharide pyruvyl transferase CsaB [Lysinibacillus yapensis]|uniref:Polysaccharide pyruvyl transferase CsaB n=1 Tax=Ureibacillus yapensis TaxID=2304605 RepID=A0A396SI48_9BACL|nr:polysaccharide pyruvyl transferase CsaB [Lysinibacillus yapensis]RHW39978.1 polysaccharide pyruvyl transferase CsaB [Lysinibacillus yapensis]